MREIVARSQARHLESIPDAWQILKLADVCKPRHDSIDPARSANSRYVGLEHMESGNPKLGRDGRGSEVKSAKSRFYVGDVLYGKLRPYLDKAVLAE